MIFSSWCSMRLSPALVCGAVGWSLWLSDNAVPVPNEVPYTAKVRPNLITHISLSLYQNTPYTSSGGKNQWELSSYTKERLWYVRSNLSSSAFARRCVYILAVLKQQSRAYYDVKVPSRSYIETKTFDSKDSYPIHIYTKTNKTKIHGYIWETAWYSS